VKLGDIVALCKGELIGGDAAADISGVGSLAEAQSGEVSFLSNPKYGKLLAETQATAVLVRRDWSGDHGCALVRVDDPNRAFADVAVALAPPPIAFAPGIHASAVVHPEAVLGAGVHIGPHCVVEAGARVGDGSVLLAGCYIGHGASVGKLCRLHAHVSVRAYCVIGSRVWIHDGTVIGSDGFGYAPRPDGGWDKIPQIGTVEIGDDVEIGANVTIDRARFGKTRVGAGVKIDNLVQIAHNVQIDANTVMAAQVGISGSTRIGRNVQLGGQAGLAGHLHVGDRAVVGAQAGVTKSVDAGTFVSGYPPMDHRRAMQLHAHVGKLPEFKKRLQALEAHLQIEETSE
jgi:UDP-3-O-[3-hydroxymyristoyl] glucosamine N-acyltransferase